MVIDKVAHVQAELNRLSGKLGIKNEIDGCKIRCPFHAGGNERTPSCKVNLTANRAGSFFCFGCKEKGSWNKLATELNLKSFKKSDQVNDVYSFTIPEMNFSLQNPAVEDYKKLKRYNGDAKWRGITPETLNLFNTRFPKHPYYNQNDFFYFPALVNKQQVGGIYARRVVTKVGKSRGEISYINSKGRWSSTNLFGFDIAKRRPKLPLWIVEGPRDCMKITQLGGRAVAIIGSYVGPKKLRLIETLDPSCVIIATDPDEAGNKAREYIHEHLTMIPVLDAVFPEGKDPANLTIRSMNRMLRNLGQKEIDNDA